MDLDQGQGQVAWMVPRLEWLKGLIASKVTKVGAKDKPMPGLVTGVLCQIEFNAAQKPAAVPRWTTARIASCYGSQGAVQRRTDL